MEETGYPECINFQIIALPDGYLFRSIHRNTCYFISRKETVAKPSEAHTDSVPEQNSSSVFHAAHLIHDPTEKPR